MSRWPTPGEAVRSIAFVVWFGLATLVLGLANLVLVRLRDRRLVVASCELWSGAHRWGVEHILGIRVVVEGTLPSGAVFVAVKHESMFEAMDMPHLLNFPAIFAKVELLKLPLWGAAGGRFGLVPVERDQGAKALRAMLSAARKLAAENRPLVIFPEGTRMPHGQRPELQAGFAGLYKMIGLPVVPMAVDSGRLLRGFWKKRGTVTYRVGEVIPAGLPREEIEKRVWTAINVLNEG